MLNNHSCFKFVFEGIASKYTSFIAVKSKDEQSSVISQAPMMTQVIPSMIPVTLTLRSSFDIDDERYDDVGFR